MISVECDRTVQSIQSAKTFDADFFAVLQDKLVSVEREVVFWQQDACKRHKIFNTPEFVPAHHIDSLWTRFAPIHEIAHIRVHCLPTR
jgi:hypothetical protein